MIRALTTLLAFLYCFVWLRPPEIGGVALPVQRLIAWACLVSLAAHLVLKGRLFAGPMARVYLGVVLLFIGFLFFTLTQRLVFGELFYPLYFIMDFSKYLAIFTVGFVCYYALQTGLVDERRFVRGITISGAAATVVVFILLVLYFAGLRTTTEILAPTWGGALGMWPTSGLLPRFAGPTAEPQQLSIVLLTPLLLMLTRRNVRTWWPIASLTLLAILLSQSKFALISLAFLVLFVYLTYERHRKLIVAGLVLLLPLLALALVRLPTFAETLAQGREAGAFVERLSNLVLLVDIIRHHALFGIGAGHYGVYWGATLHGDPLFAPGYTPNMDFLKVFAELGIVGFVVLGILLGQLFRHFLRASRAVPAAAREQYRAFLLGAAAILCNMAIGYELLHVFFWINVGALMYLAESAPHIDAAAA